MRKEPNFFFEKTLSRQVCDINLKISVPKKTENTKAPYIAIFSTDKFNSVDEARQGTSTESKSIKNK